MAAIAQIRKRGGMLVVVIGIAMGGFLLMDVVSSDSSILFGNQNLIGVVDGVDVENNEQVAHSYLVCVGVGGFVDNRVELFVGIQRRIAGSPTQNGEGLWPSEKILNIVRRNSKH